MRAIFGCSVHRNACYTEGGKDPRIEGCNPFSFPNYCRALLNVLSCITDILTLKNSLRYFNGIGHTPRLLLHDNSIASLGHHRTGAHIDTVSCGNC